MAMSEFFEAFLHYWSGADFMPRAHCERTPGAWGFWVWVNIFANLVTSFSFFAFTYQVFISFNKRLTLFAKINSIAVALFVGVCAVDHLFDVLSFWTAPYRLITVWSVLLAIAALIGAITNAYSTDGILEERVDLMETYKTADVLKFKRFIENDPDLCPETKIVALKRIDKTLKIRGLKT